MDADTLLDDVDALAAGKAYAVLEGYARVDVGGRDAVPWLHDLLTADIASIPVGGARRSLLLTPTGRIRADVHVIRRDERVELLERADEPATVAAALAPYVLSSDVSLGDPVRVRLVVFPAAGAADRVRDAMAASRVAASSPSVLGDGVDALVEGSLEPLIRALDDGIRPVTAAAADALRIHRGIPSWRLDVQPDALVVGARIDDAIADTKGCFLGQEAVARIRNLGHPPTVVRHLVTTSRPTPGEPVLRDGEVVGRVTSAAPSRRGTIVLALVHRRAAVGDLSFADGGWARDVEPASDVTRLG